MMAQQVQVNDARPSKRELCPWDQMVEGES